MSECDCYTPLQPLPLMPVYGKFDLTTYVEGSSDYEIMARVIETYNNAVKLFNELLNEYNKIYEKFEELRTDLYAKVDAQNKTIDDFKATVNATITAFENETNQNLQNIRNDFNTQFNVIDSKILTLNGEVDKLKTDLQRLLDGELIDAYVKALSEWIDNNLQTLVSRIVKYVWFDLTDDGYFRAYIPDKWSFIDFNTDTDMSNDEYGKLALEWIPEED